MTDPDCPHCGTWHRTGSTCPAPDDSAGSKVRIQTSESECQWCGEAFDYLGGEDDRFCSDLCEGNARDSSREREDRLPEDE